MDISTTQKMSPDNLFLTCTEDNDREDFSSLEEFDNESQKDMEEFNTNMDNNVSYLDISNIISTGNIEVETDIRENSYVDDTNLIGHYLDITEPVIQEVGEGYNEEQEEERVNEEEEVKEEEVKEEEERVNEEQEEEKVEEGEEEMVNEEQEEEKIEEGEEEEEEERVNEEVKEEEQEVKEEERVNEEEKIEEEDEEVKEEEMVNKEEEVKEEEMVNKEEEVKEEEEEERVNEQEEKVEEEERVNEEEEEEEEEEERVKVEEEEKVEEEKEEEEERVKVEEEEKVEEEKEEEEERVKVEEKIKVEEFLTEKNWVQYVLNYEDLIMSEVITYPKALDHWLRHGKNEGRQIAELPNRFFDWKSYIENNIDLLKIGVNSREKAINHWIRYGCREGRQIQYTPDEDLFDWEYYLQNNEDIKINGDNIKEEALKHWHLHGKKENRKHKYIISKDNCFDWIQYRENYEDLKHILHTYEEALHHWNNHGQKEGRTFEKIIEPPIEEFDWKQYVANYIDLQECGINTYEKALHHWVHNGKREGRNYINIYEEGFKQYDNFELSNVNNNLFFKPKYDNYGLHYCGWEKVINVFISQYKEKEIKCKMIHELFFDEWLEKLLLWGNKMVNEKFLYKIRENKLHLISFIHNPYYIPEPNCNKKGLLLSDDAQFNKNLFKLIEKEQLSNNIEYLYCLSLSHKEILCNKYPQYQNKFVSVYHPIMSDENISFSYELFLSNKHILHIGWWLRNFNSFINFKLPPSYKKKIIIKDDFKQDFFKNITIPKNNNIEFKYQLSNEKYREVFTNSVIFADIVEGVANNTILECILFNTPIILRRTPSSEEYLGKEYPLFFNTIEELFYLYDESVLLNLIQSSHNYLRNMDKTHISIETFNNKLNYDLDKLHNSTSDKILTWVLLITHTEIYKLYLFIEEFLKQENVSELYLDVVYSPEGDNQYLLEVRKIKEKYQNNKDIRWREIDLEKSDQCIMNETFENCLTEFMTLVQVNDTFETNFSKTHIHYLKENPSCDISTSGYYIINENNDLLLNSFNKNQSFIFSITETLSNNNIFVWRTSISNYISIHNIPVTEFSILLMEYFVKQNLNLKCCSQEPLHTINLNMI